MNSEFTIVKEKEPYKIIKGSVTIGLYTPYNQKVLINQPVSVSEMESILETIKEST